MPALCNEDVGGLDVTVDDSFGMCRAERIRDLGISLQHLIDRQRLSGNAILERLAVEKLHGDEFPAAVFADVVDGANIRMIEGGGCFRFTLEAFERVRIVGHIVRKEL